MLNLPPAPMPDDAPEIEDDVAELVHHLIVSEMQSDPTGPAKDQLRDALTKLIDARVSATLLRPCCDPAATLPAR